ncbi:hypothetical protein AALA90_12880 [Lachnospiraceae bacterium 38-10]
MEKSSKITTNEKSLSDLSARQQKEAVLRLEQLTEIFGLKKDFLNWFQDGVVAYCYKTCQEDGFAAPKDFNLDWRLEKESFEYVYDTLVYLVLVNKTVCGEMLSMLYVSSNEEDWECARLTEDYITAYVYNLDMEFGEFGDIFLTSKDGVPIRWA